MMDGVFSFLQGIGQMFLPGFAPPDTPFETDNPRERRVICALAVGPKTREELDRVAGASNVPDAIAALRHRGLDIPSCREPVRDCDGQIVQRGRYRFTEADRQRTRGIWEGRTKGTPVNIPPAVIEIRLILSAPGVGWEYVARKHGEAIAASDGDAVFPQPGAALVACVAEIKAELPQQGGGDGR